MISMAGWMTEFERITWRRYHVPGCSDLHRLKVNTVVISAANSEAHELEKCRQAHKLLVAGHKFITEAVDGQSEKRRDLVDLTTGEVFEVESVLSGRSKRHGASEGVRVVFYDGTS